MPYDDSVGSGVRPGWFSGGYAMAKGVKTVVTVNGRVETRVSESRVYTHAVLVLKDGAKRKAHVEAPFAGKELKELRESWDNFHKYVGGEWVPSTVTPWTGDDWMMSVDRVEKHWTGTRPLVIKAETKAHYEAESAKGWEGWLAEQHASRLAQFRKDVSVGRFQWKVLGWTSSVKAGSKRSELKYYDQHKIVPVGSVVTLEGDYQSEDLHHNDCPAVDGFACHCDGVTLES